VGFFGQLAKQAAARVFDLALDRIFLVELVQSPSVGDTEWPKQKEPERVEIAQALNSPEANPSMTATLKPEPISQQDSVEQTPSVAPVQASLPWNNPKYNREELSELSLSTEQFLRQEKKRQKREASLAREALERELELERREVGFGCRIMIQATLPHSDPNQGLTPKQPEWRGQFTRKNGNLSLTIQAREEYGFPYGTYPRLLTSWIATEVVATKQRELALGRSLRDFLEKLDLSPTAGKRGTMPRLKNQMLRFFTATFSATEQTDGRMRNVGFLPVSKMELFWDAKHVDQSSLWQSTIVLSEDFFNELVKRPVPLDMGTLRALAKSKSPLAIDIYAWLTYRYSYLHEATLIPWELLKLQFGADYSEERFFKRKFLVQLANVKELYGEAKFEITNDGLRLFPSRPHVRLLRA
jgi:hypothetical protein